MENKNKTLTELLCEIQAELKAPKGQYNSFGKYKYRSAEDILEAAKPLANKRGCIILLRDILVNINERYYVQATASIEKGNETIFTTALAREEEAKKGMDASQITGATSSYARKIALNGLFAIDDAKDSDYTNTHKKEEVNISIEEKEKIRFKLGELINSASTDIDFNKIIESLKKNPVIANNSQFKGELWATINNAAEFHNLAFNKETKRFEPINN